MRNVHPLLTSLLTQRKLTHFSVAFAACLTLLNPLFPLQQAAHAACQCHLAPTPYGNGNLATESVTLQQGGSWAVSPNRPTASPSLKELIAQHKKQAMAGQGMGGRNPYHYGQLTEEATTANDAEAEDSTPIWARAEGAQTPLNTKWKEMRSFNEGAEPLFFSY